MATDKQLINGKEEEEGAVPLGGGLWKTTSLKRQSKLRPFDKRSFEKKEVFRLIMRKWTQPSLKLLKGNPSRIVK